MKLTVIVNDLYHCPVVILHNVDTIAESSSRLPQGQDKRLIAFDQTVVSYSHCETCSCHSLLDTNVVIRKRHIIAVIYTSKKYTNLANHS